MKLIVTTNLNESMTIRLVNRNNATTIQLHSLSSRIASFVTVDISKDNPRLLIAGNFKNLADMLNPLNLLAQPSAIIFT